MNREAEWARDAAQTIITEFDDAAAIDTADYQLCGFMLAAAKIAMTDADLCRKIGALMEPERPKPAWIR